MCSMYRTLIQNTTIYTLQVELRKYSSQNLPLAHMQPTNIIYLEIALITCLFVLIFNNI